MEIHDSFPACQVQDAEYHRLLGWPRDHVPGERARELAAWARAWYAEHGHPWVYARRVRLLDDGTALQLDGTRFESARLRRYLHDHGAQRAVVLAASAGRECEEHARELWEEGRPDEYFFLETFGSAVVEDLVARLNGRLCALAADDGWVAVPHYSPGYEGWDVAEQTRLLPLIAGGAKRPLPGPIAVLPSGMLRPKKSLLAVCGLAPASAGTASRASTPCVGCAFTPCSFRREPYRHAATAGAATPAPAAIRATRPLTRDATYTVNSRALRKWAQERVQLRWRADGCIVAAFRFDGTTCTNLGEPLAFEYSVVLSAPDDGCQILDSGCAPVSGEEGFRKMCAFVQDEDALMGDIAAEKPLLGRPLDDVLAWNRAAVPAACHCTAESRMHKWGLALEAIHFALAQSRATPSGAGRLLPS